MKRVSNKPLISVIVPVYNVEKYLNKCVDSIINQTYKNLEIILVDDGSKDNCPSICDKYKNKDKRIKAIHKENGGLSDARNVGIDIATGKYLTFIDSDDFIDKDYIDYLFTLLNKNDSDLSICDLARINEDTNYKNKKKDKEFILAVEEAFEKLLYSDGIDVSACGKLYKKELFDSIRFPIGKAYEDTATTYKIFNMCKKITYGNQQKYFYVRRNNSISKQGFNKKELDYQKYTDEMLNNIKENYPKLINGIKRYYFYSRARLLRILCEDKTSEYSSLKKEYYKDIKMISKSVFKDKKAPKRDKMAILSLKFGLSFFEKSWLIYKKLTKRI